MKSLGGHLFLMIISLLKQKAFIFLICDKNISAIDNTM